MTPRSRRIGWWVAGGLLAAVALYAVVGYFLVSHLARRELVQRGSSALHRDVTVGELTVNPFTFTAKLGQVRIAGAGPEPFATLASATIQFKPLRTLQQPGWHFGEVSLDAPGLRLTIDEQGRLNIADLQTSTEDPRAPALIRIERLTIDGGTLHFSDLSGPTPFATTIVPINVALTDFSTEPGEAGSVRVTGATTTGGRFAWNGTLQIAPEFRSTGQVQFDEVEIPAYLPLVADYLRGEIRSGRLHLAGDYELSLGPEPQGTLEAVTLRITNLALAAAASTEAAVELGELTVEMPEARLFEPSARIERVAIERFKVRAQRDSDGNLDLANLIRRPAAAEADTGAGSGSGRTSPPAGAADEGRAPTFRIGEIVAREGTVTFTDLTTRPEPSQLEVEDVQITARALSSNPGDEFEMDVALRWAGGPGRFHAAGTGRLQPFAAKVQLSATDLELAPAGAYLQEFLAVRLLSGRATFAGELEASASDNGPPALRWTGRIGLDDFDVRDARLDHALANWIHLGLEGAEVGTRPLRVAVREMRLNRPALHALRTEDGALNLSALTKGPSPDRKEENAAGDSPAPAGPENFTASIGKLTIEEGSITFADRSVEPEFATAITALEGTVTGLSSEPGALAELDLTGTLAGAAPLEMDGEINLRAENVFTGAVLVDLANLPLEHFEPYAQRYLGYGIEQGRMRGNFEYIVTPEKLSGANEVVLDEFALGEAVQSPDALSVPVKLAVSVLRNRQGEVVLNIPVSGSLESPEFSFGGAIRRAVRNVIVRAATAPLSFLGSLFGIGDDLTQIEFAPGDVLLEDATKARLDSLARILEDRTGLALVINWRPMETVDRDVLKEKRLQQLIQEERELLAADRPESKHEIGEEQAIRSLVRRRFPQLAPELARKAEAAEPAAEPAERDRPPWYARLFGSIFGRRGVAAQSEGESGESQGGEPAGPAVAELRERLINSLRLTQEDYTEIARTRARAAREHLIAAGIDPHRVEIADRPLPEDQPKTAAADRALVYFEVKEAVPAAPGSG